MKKLATLLLCLFLLTGICGMIGCSSGYPSGDYSTPTDSYSNSEEGVTDSESSSTELCQHDYETVVTEPTCTEQGYTTYTCTICGDTCIDNYIDTTDHNYVNGVCINCSDTKTTPYEHFTFTELPDGTYSVKAKDASKIPTKVDIPSIYNEKAVTNIGEEAFYHCYRLTEVVIPDSVISIGDYAFSHCSDLTEIAIPNSVTSIGNYAFSVCFSLSEIVIPDSVTSIGSDAFADCGGLTEIIIPKSVTSIGGWAFYNCSSLTNVEIPNSVTEIGYNAFYSCGSLTEIKVSENNPNYKDIDGNLYSKDGKTLVQYAIGKKEASFTIPNSVTTIGIGAFAFSSLTEIVIPNSVTIIDGAAFEICRSLTEIVIPNSVTSIGDYAFDRCSSLTSVTIPDSVTSIGDWAFNNCGLTNVTIGESVVEIGDSAFYECFKLVEVINNSPHITVVKGSGSNGFLGAYALAVYNNGDTFTGTKLSNDNNYIIYTDGTEKILVGYAGTETNLSLPSYVTKINPRAFRNCWSLTEIVIPDNITEIGKLAFSGCWNLKSVTIGNAVISIGSYAFSDCGKLNVYYRGTEEDWSKITIGSYNSELTNATRYYYSESEPTTDGNYWHYVDGKPTVWGKEN